MDKIETRKESEDLYTCAKGLESSYQSAWQVRDYSIPLLKFGIDDLKGGKVELSELYLQNFMVQDYIVTTITILREKDLIHRFYKREFVVNVIFSIASVM